MDKGSIYNRDLLFPTENLAVPGCVHIEMYNPDAESKIPVVVEGKTEHSPVKYMDTILRIMQYDIFDRIFVGIKTKVNLYIRCNDDTSREFGGSRYLKLNFAGDKIEYSGVNEI